MHITILPGWQQNCSHWQPVTSILTDKGAVVDCVSIFQNDNINPYEACTDIASVAEMLVEKLKHNDPKTILVGHSFGGRVAAYVAAKHPELLTALVLVGSPNLYRPTFKTQLVKMAAYILKPVRSLIPASIRAKMRTNDYAKVKGTNLEKLFQNVITDDQQELLEQINVPTLLIWGENDPDVPLSIGKEIEKTIQGAKLTTYNAVGHNVHMEKSSLLANNLITYANSF